jgi:hypothetical protein
MKTYKGTRHCGSTDVRVDGVLLNPRYDLHLHSPNGFEWGYGGSGPAQLALAILGDHLGDEEALNLYQRFKWAVIAELPWRDWTLTSNEVEEALDRIRNRNTVTGGAM